MKRMLMIIGFLLALLCLIGAMFVIVNLSGKSNSNQSQNSSSSFPIGASKNTSGNSNNSVSRTSSIISIPSKNGTSIATLNFIQSSTTLQDPENPGTYYLAGSIGYCNSDGSCPSGAPSNEYHIVYFTQSNSFIISLISEPVGQARLDAQAFLMKSLGIEEEQMCNLKYDVLTTASVNSVYAGEELGFSFCPGAVTLP